MNQSFTKEEMNTCLNRLAAYRGVQLSCYCLATCLALSFFVLLLINVKTVSPLYILLVLCVLPSLIEGVTKSKEEKQGKQNKKRENHLLPFPLLVQKYNYSDRRYTALNFTFMIVLLLIAAWRLNYMLFPVSKDWICHLPTYIIASGLVFRITVFFCYRIYFHYFPLHSMR